MAIEPNNNANERLLDAAEGLFAENGFNGTSIRDITAAAGCNVAGVNYHFGSKDKLYIEVFRRRMVVLRDVRIRSVEAVMSKPGETTLEELLDAFANAFVEPLIGETGGQRLMKLMAREMIDAHLPMNIFVEEVIQPTMAVLLPALKKVCPGLDREAAMMCVFSLVGQLIHAIRIREMFASAETSEFAIMDTAKLSEHIVKFTATAILGMVRGKTE